MESANVGAGGFGGVASAFACLDVVFDVVALCGRIGADDAFAGAATVLATGRRCSRGDNTAVVALGRRGAAADRTGCGRGTGGGGQATSDHPGHRAQGQAGKGKAGAGRANAYCDAGGAQTVFAL